MLTTLTAHSMERESRLTDNSYQGHQGTDGDSKRARPDIGDEEGRPWAFLRIGNGIPKDIGTIKGNF